MKNNPLFDKCVANVPPEVMAEVSLNVDIANRIYDLLKKKKMNLRFPDGLPVLTDLLLQRLPKLHPCLASPW